MRREKGEGDGYNYVGKNCGCRGRELVGVGRVEGERWSRERERDGVERGSREREME